ncbi:MAG: flagellar hook-basal body complex protein [Alicyclobacillus sp.]|nr:flagellar hook-basal body complex protein [Alicyclobacillus sp.]
MLRSMSSAISGMDSFQTQLDVIGNNIANVNTPGFKAGRVDFANVLSQTIAGASAGTQNTVGGTSPQQVGLGAKVGAIQTLFMQGAPQSTGNALDVDINGNGLLVAKDSSGGTYYTRAGDMSLDNAGNLVLPNGMIVQGYTAASPGGQTLTPINILSLAQAANVPSTSLPASPNVQIGPDGALSVTLTDGTQKTIGYLALATFTNYGGLSSAGDNLFTQTSDSGAPTYEQPGTSSGTLQSGYLEGSNVDLTQEFANMIVAQRGFDANSKMIGTDYQILNDVVNLKNG